MAISNVKGGSVWAVSIDCKTVHGLTRSGSGSSCPTDPPTRGPSSFPRASGSGLVGAPEFNSTILLRIQEPFGSLTPFSVNQDGLLIASGNERKPDLVCRQVQHLFFFFSLKWNVWLMLKNWDTAHMDLNFQIFWKIIGFGTTGPLSPGAISWQYRTASHLTRGCALQLPVGPPAPTVLVCRPCSFTQPSTSDYVRHSVAPSKHEALCKSLEIGTFNTAPTLEELANQVYTSELQRCQLSAEQKKA